MGSEETYLQLEPKEKTFHIYKEFMTRVTKLEELGAVGSGFLSSYKLGLEFLRRPPINKTSKLVENIIKANETKRVTAYFEAGCIHVHDNVQNMSKLRISLNGLHNHLNEADVILNELDCLLKDAATAVQTANESLLSLQDKAFSYKIDLQDTSDQEVTAPSLNHEPDMTDFAALMAIIYNMVKKDYVMQEHIVTSLSIESLLGELESYGLMWSLRPYVNDEIMHQAWRLIS